MLTTTHLKSREDQERGDTPSQAQWTLSQRLGFRFAFVYLTIVALNDLQYRVMPISWASKLDAWYYYLIIRPGTWLGTTAFGGCFGSPQPVYNCQEFQAIWMASLALAGAGIWTAIDRERRDYRRLHAWLRTFLRYCLALIMWWYGWGKLLGNQFLPGFETETLLTPLGQLYKGGLLWESIGYSFPYQFFGGFGEVLGAALLLWRRTATLGAIIIIMVMANVVGLDLAHHIMVTVGAWNYMMMAVFVAAPDARRLASLYIHNQSVAPGVKEPPLLSGDWWPLAKFMMVAAIFLLGFIPNPPKIGHYGIHPTRHPMTGVYEVEKFILNGDTVPALVGDSARWSRVVIGTKEPWPGAFHRLRSKDKPRFIQTASMSGSWKAFEIELDTSRHRLILGEPPTPNAPLASAKRQAAVGILDYKWADSTHLELRGALSGDSLTVRLHRLYDEASVFWGGRGYFASERGRDK